MYYFIASLLVLTGISFSLQAYPDEKEGRYTPTVHYSSPSYHYNLQPPSTPQEWGTYHAIRIAEIHNTYCPGQPYNLNDPEETWPRNHRFILTKNGEVVGTIRIDLLAGREAALRWVAITRNQQRKGHGKIMLRMAEVFMRHMGRTIIRVPAAKDFAGFYEKLGYEPAEWSEGPRDAGNVPMIKRLFASRL